jgi:hypothetical protein
MFIKERGPRGTGCTMAGKIDILQLQCELQTAQADFNKWAGDLMESIEDTQNSHVESLNQRESEEIVN